MTIEQLAATLSETNREILAQLDQMRADLAEMKSALGRVEADVVRIEAELRAWREREP